MYEQRDTWDKQVATIEWSRLLSEGKAPNIPVELIDSIPTEWDYFDILGVAIFNIN